MRPMSEQLTLGGMAPAIGIGDELDRCYTPDALAAAIVALQHRMDPATILEPHVGGAAFGRAGRKQWPAAHVTGFDLDVNAPGFRFCDAGRWVDFLDAAKTVERGSFDLIIGNPPFSGDTAIPHVEAALKLDARRVVFILPLAFLAVDRWAWCMDGVNRPDIVRPIRPRPWGDRVREVAVYEWTRNYVDETRMIPLEWK
jgi:hypothetical protein